MLCVEPRIGRRRRLKCEAPRMLDPDDPLMQRLRSAAPARREEAFRQLVQRHAGPLAGFLRSFVSDRVEVEDLVQEVFLRVYRAQERYQPGGGARFRTWLFRIGRNLALNARRDRARRRSTQLEEAWVGADPAPGPLGEAIAGQQVAAVRAALARLEGRDREVLALRFREGLEHKEIARVVGGSPAAVKQRVWRVLQRLKQELGPEVAS